MSHQSDQVNELIVNDNTTIKLMSLKHASINFFLIFYIIYSKTQSKMPLPLDVTKEDFTSFKYNLKVHVIFLVTMGVLELVGNLFLYINYPTDLTGQFVGLFVYLLFFLFWWLFGHEKCASSFPAFLYITPKIEYVVRCLAVFGLFIILLLMVAIGFAIGPIPIVILLLVLVILEFVFYAYIVFKITLCVITIFSRSPSEKEIVGREIHGLAVEVSRDGPSAHVMAKV